jgi:2-oxoglutarate dehydrogenase E2 component (dihydrolipoamide succinyltransferase)
MKELIIAMPKMGESVMEATIIKWLKGEGDEILEAESILEVATDKVDSEIPTPYTGKLKKLLVQVGEVVAVGVPIAILEVEDITLEHEYSTLKPKTALQAIPTIKSLNYNSQSTKHALQVDARNTWPLYDTTGRFYSPLVRYIAQKESLSLEEMESIPSTGKDNRVTKQDILTYLVHKKHSQSIPSYNNRSSEDIQQYAKPGDEIIPMDRVRKLIAERMVAAMHTVPHVTSFVEADVTELVQWRERNKLAFKQKAGVGLTYTPIFVKAVAQAIQKFPLINVSVVEGYIIKRKAINIGLAVALPDGNLIVPVVKNADQLTLSELAIYIHELVHNARHGQLLPDDIVDGTYTISNIGSFQNLMGTPIIMQPQVAILAVGAIVKKPAVIETSQGDQIAIRRKMYLSHTYDHRVVDGALGGQFAKAVADYLEKFDFTAEVENI